MILTNFSFISILLKNDDLWNITKFIKLCIEDRMKNKSSYSDIFSCKESSSQCLLTLEYREMEDTHEWCTNDPSRVLFQKLQNFSKKNYWEGKN